MDDINILDRSTVVGQIINLELLIVFESFEYPFNQMNRNLCNFLTNTIYPKWAIFIDTMIVHAIFQTHKTLDGPQEEYEKIWKERLGYFVQMAQYC